MPSKETKTKSRSSDSKPDAETGTSYAGGNPGFDERKPTSRSKTGETVHAGVNPNFDERQSGKAKSG